MKFCKYCGNPVDDNAIFCKSCGARVSDDGPAYNSGPYGNPYGGYGQYNNPYPFYDNTPSKAIAILSFLFWEIGAILWFFWRRTRPGKARSALKGALAGASFNMPVLGLILWIMWRYEYDKQDFAKACGIAAIVGASIYALTVILMVVLHFAGVELMFVPEYIEELGGMAAFILGR